MTSDQTSDQTSDETSDQTSPKTVLVTGASRGLGRSSARHLAAAGYRVIGTYASRRDEADALLSELDDAGVPGAVLALDVEDAGSFGAFADSVRALLDGWGVQGLHGVVHFAGYGVFAPFSQTSTEQLEAMLRVHVTAPFALTQALLPLLGDGSRVLNVSSGLTRFNGSGEPAYAAYAAAKGAVEVLTRYQAGELGARGIRVNALAPGAIATDFGGGVVRDVAEVAEAMARDTALGRVGRPDDIGAALPLLLADGFGWASGTRIELSGGQSL